MQESQCGSRTRIEVSAVNYAEQIINFAKKNNGVVTAAQVTEAGINRYYLTLLVR